jgi:hypothetical protein
MWRRRMKVSRGKRGKNQLLQTRIYGMKAPCLEHAVVDEIIHGAQGFTLLLALFSTGLDCTEVSWPGFENAQQTVYF